MLLGGIERPWGMDERWEELGSLRIPGPHVKREGFKILKFNVTEIESRLKARLGKKVEKQELQDHAPHPYSATMFPFSASS